MESSQITAFVILSVSEESCLNPFMHRKDPSLCSG
jgi:hypothetical protein